MKTSYVALGVVAALGLFARPLSAQPVEFTVDPDRSEVSLSGSSAGYPLQQQGPGSLSTRYDGTIRALMGTDTIQFVEGSAISARNSGKWAPMAGGVAGTEDACYGGKASALFVTAQAAVRRILLDIESNPLPLTGGQFDGSKLVFSFPTNSTAQLDYLVTGLLSRSGGEQLAGYATNSITTPSRIETAGNLQTLTLPISAEYTLTLVSTGDTRLRLTGQLVATRTVDGGGATFESWLAIQFPGITDPAQVGPGADPEGDGLPNLVEFAFGLNPNASEAGFAPLKGGVPVAGTWTLEFVRPVGLTGIQYVLQGSGDLAVWNDVAVSPMITPAGDGQERLTYAQPAPAGEADYQFVRLVVRR